MPQRTRSGRQRVRTILSGAEKVGATHLSEFDYDLPEELIAQRPPARRDDSRMLVLYRDEERWEDRLFRDFPLFLKPDDCLVLNDSKVFPSRLFGHRTGSKGQVETFLIRPVSQDRKDWEALVRPGRTMRVGEVVHFGEDVHAEILSRGEYGLRTLRFSCDGDLDAEMERIGHVPLPPYIKRQDEPADRERYQTVFARQKGSVAAPTAGLHFTPEILSRCQDAGAETAYVTLHVGLGTFQPLHEEVIEGNRLHVEHYEITPENLTKMEAARRRVAVGTTSVRAMESVMRTGSVGDTQLFIYPGFEFRSTGAVLTNFHLPRTSLLLLVCAFGGKELVMSAYRHAVNAKYRFYSYGDCMLIV